MDELNKDGSVFDVHEEASHLDKLRIGLHHAHDEVHLLLYGLLLGALRLHVGPRFADRRGALDELACVALILQILVNGRDYIVGEALVGCEVRRGDVLAAGTIQRHVGVSRE